ncbi:tyrosine-protein phosphatase non-receptor type substrate 1-like [Erythrolamprus reginae]|uniref:tyrosine-protein phosphatase non-receptor type substrate 1-like n=1 Tax=Erythrolamprus reginae TaxID=121349 RepID=UPI00396C7AD7
MAARRSFKRIAGSLQFLLLLLPWGLVVTGQNIKIIQLPAHVSVKAGDNLTLQCVLSGANIPGGVRWYKGKDRSQTPIHSDRQGASNRGVRVIPGDNADFGIIIQNIRPEDDGTYFCVKFRAGVSEKELVSGEGTLVSVIAEPSQPVVLGRTRRITAGSRASFNCSTGGFFPREITVSWLKNGKKIPAAPANILDSEEKQSITYRAESTVEILLERGDVKSQLTCQIQHKSLEGRGPLQQTFALGAVLRVPPKVHLETNPSSPVQLNISMLVTCNADSFYPYNAKMELFPKDAPGRKGKVGVKTSNQDGTFNLKSSLEMLATEDRNHSIFLCQVRHDSQPLVNEGITLFIRLSGDGPESSPSLLVLWIPLFLTKVAILFFISCLFLMKVPVCKNTKHHSTEQKTEPQNIPENETV